MGKAFWIKIGLELFFRWLVKQKKQGNPTSPLVGNLIEAKTIDDLMNIVTDKETEEIIDQIVTDVAKEPAGNIFTFLFGWLFK